MQIETQERVQVGPPLIQTAEDARMAFLREQISEKELKEILGKFGHSLETSSLVPHPNNFDRVDDAFKRSLPEEEAPERASLEDNLKAVKEKEKERQQALKSAKVPDKVENVPAGTADALQKRKDEETKTAPSKSASSTTKSTSTTRSATSK